MVSDDTEYTISEPKGLLSVREAAVEYGRNPETVRRWIWNGKVRAQKLGNQLFIRREDLNQMVKNDADNEKAARKAARFAALEAVIAMGERIGGNIDVVETLKHERESHPSGW